MAGNTDFEMAGNMDSELLLKFIGYFPDYLPALSRTLLRFFGQPLSKQLYIKHEKACFIRYPNTKFFKRLRDVWISDETHF